MNVPPVISCGVRLPARARPASSRVSAAISRQALAVGVADHRDDEPVVQGDRDTHVDPLVHEQVASLGPGGRSAAGWRAA